MDRSLAERLNALNTAFYAENAASFSETRQAPWPGWHRCAKLIGALGAAHDHTQGLHVVDVASGNLRFERFLARTKDHRRRQGISAPSNLRQWRLPFGMEEQRASVSLLPQLFGG